MAKIWVIEIWANGISSKLSNLIYKTNTTENTLRLLEMLFKIKYFDRCVETPENFRWPQFLPQLC